MKFLCQHNHSEIMIFVLRLSPRVRFNLSQPLACCIVVEGFALQTGFLTSRDAHSWDRKWNKENLNCRTHALNMCSEDSALWVDWGMDARLRYRDRISSIDSSLSTVSTDCTLFVTIT